MPELPEVETVARQLAPLLTGRRIRRFATFDPRLDGLASGLFNENLVRRVHRIGKEVVLTLEGSSGAHLVAVHLRMTGRLIWLERGQTAPHKHLRARWWLQGGGSLLFVDSRRFGTITAHADEALLLSRGLDPMSQDFTESALRALMGRGSGMQQLKTWLLRQDRLVGLGNIYASEIPFRAGLHPATQVGSLRANESRRLYNAITEVLGAAIEHCGTTFSDFQTVRGSVGSYQECLAVYRRAGEPCRLCGALVEKFVQQQRTTFFCPICQSPGPV